jgi:hypothetical protein
LGPSAEWAAIKGANAGCNPGAFLWHKAGRDRKREIGGETKLASNANRGGGVMISTSIFENQSGAEESTKRAADYVREKMASLLPKPPQITAGEVVAHKTK